MHIARFEFFKKTGHLSGQQPPAIHNLTCLPPASKFSPVTGPVAGSGGVAFPGLHGGPPLRCGRLPYPTLEVGRETCQWNWDCGPVPLTAGSPTLGLRPSPPHTHTSSSAHAAVRMAAPAAMLTALANVYLLCRINFARFFVQSINNSGASKN